MRSVLTVLAASTIICQSALADPGLVGAWQLRVDSRMGVQTPILTINENDGVFSGSIGGARGTLDIEKIEVDGQSFSFPFKMTTPVREFTLLYKGTRDGDKLTGTVDAPRGPVPFTGERMQ